CRVCPHERAGLSLARRTPQRKIRHPRQASQSRTFQPPQSDDDTIEQRAEDLWPAAVKFVLQRLVGLTALLRYGIERQEDCSVGQVRSVNKVLDPVEHRRPLYVENLLFVVGIKPPRRKPAAGRQSAQGIREP